ncbi:MAG: SDR family oxidoreductase [Microscillaceae bacterium]|nr:SDR family oxidoreductase [Microscillaceae bacterium]
MKKILITGSNGLLGQKLVHLLNQEPYNTLYQIIASSRGENRVSAFQSLHYESLDVSQAEDVNRVIGLLKPQIIIHTAAMTQVDQCETEKELCWSLNVKAVENLINACRENNSFLIHLSTDFIFDGDDGPYDEEATANPVSYYGESKLEAEKLLRESDIRWAIVRTVLVYGITEAMSRSNIILWVKKSLEEGKSIQVVDDQWRTPTLAEDLALGCVLIADQEKEGIYNISGKDFLSPYEMALQTADFFNLDKSLIVRTDGSKFSQPAKRPPKTGFIIEKARRELGYEPHSFKEGIALLSTQIEM